jgi:Zn-dependent membrane protease YugP
MYYIFMIVGMALVFWAQWRVKATYNKYSQIPSSMGMTGRDVAVSILQSMGVDGIVVEPVPGELSDHYDPTAKVVRLSEGVYNSTSLAAAAVAAHECGHVLQDVKGYKPMNVRAALVPAVNLGSNLGPILIILGFAIVQLGSLSSIFINIGIALFASVVIFHIVTLPVEFDASNRALKLINELGILQGEENKAAKKVLDAAAFTYVATAIYALLQLLQLLLSRD